MEEKAGDELLSCARGMRDFLPAEKRLRDGVTQLLKGQFELYGFEPLETPAVERYEVLSSKYAGGDEILKEVFQLTDQGKRKLGLRYDLTVPLCRLIAANPRMAMPFKRYCIAPVWRDGPLKQGRYREFYQCDVDTVGSASMLADAEIIALAADALGKLFGNGFSIKVSNRKILFGIMEQAGIPQDKIAAATLSIDKLSKIGKDGVLAELAQKGIARGAGEKALELAAIKTPKDLEKRLSGAQGKEGIFEVTAAMELAAKMGAGARLEFDASLARGLAYYTGTIFEAFLNDSPITSSVAGGGRYDDLIGKFAGRGGQVPAVGISFGLDVICEALKVSRKAPAAPAKKAYVIPISKEGSKEVLAAALAALNEIRSAGIPASIDLMGRSVSKNFEYAAKGQFSYAVMVGEDEVKQGKLKVRNLATGEEKLVAAGKIAKALE